MNFSRSEVATEMSGKRDGLAEDSICVAMNLFGSLERERKAEVVVSRMGQVFDSLTESGHSGSEPRGAGASIGASFGDFWKNDGGVFLVIVIFFFSIVI
ncbi:hypothetical protein Ddye_029212 [Dipteronia dyeriana]|uniref:Uncharacterized protein n=1 Tax=Dipteronia dyeriana TaxID=168575 RepID=A0AAD9TF98_9ROSI|nr:hypothetical protein Ddye_029212 [Dipteronia dyeriana]